MTVVILSAFVPTLIAQQLFQPTVIDAEEEEALGEEDLSIIHHRPATHPARPGLTGPPRHRMKAQNPRAHRTSSEDKASRSK